MTLPFKTRPRAKSESPACWQIALARLEGAYAANTIRSYRNDYMVFERWCHLEGRTTLPAEPETVADFVTAQSRTMAPATVNRRRAAIAKVHRLLKLASPIDSEEVNLAMRSVFRRKGHRQDQALGLTELLKKSLIEACPDSLRGWRDRALIVMGYDTLCRRSELVQLRIEDLTTRADGSGSILVRKSKTDQLGHGRLAYLSPDAVSRIQRWLVASDLKNGPILRGICGLGPHSEALHPYSVARILKDRARDAGIDANIVARLSGHSMRVGAAQDMAAAGIDLTAIMHAGGWKSPGRVMRYIEHMDVQRSGMARLHGSCRNSG